MKYFTYEYKKACNLGKLYLLARNHKRFFNVPGRPVISNCGTPSEKDCEFLDHCLKPIMQNGLSYIRDSQHFLEKIKTIGSVPKNIILVIAEGLYPNNPHQAGLKTLRAVLEKRNIKKIPTEDLVKMAEFVLNNNDDIFTFNNTVYQQKLGTAIGTKFLPCYTCIYMDEVERKFLETQSKKPLIWLRYIDIFFIWTIK